MPLRRHSRSASWTGVEHAEVLTADLANAYADPATFGYARLALLEGALAEAGPSPRVVRDGGGNRLAWRHRCRWAAWARQCSTCASHCCA